MSAVSQEVYEFATLFGGQVDETEFLLYMRLSSIKALSGATFVLSCFAFAFVSFSLIFSLVANQPYIGNLAQATRVLMDVNGRN